MPRVRLRAPSETGRMRLSCQKDIQYCIALNGFVHTQRETARASLRVIGGEWAKRYRPYDRRKASERVGLRGSGQLELVVRTEELGIVFH